MKSAFSSLKKELLLKMPLAELIFYADKVRRRYINKVKACSIINAKSGLCSQDCKFCAQSLRYKTGISAYPLVSTKVILAAAKQAKNNGAQRFSIVTSGNRLSKKELKQLAAAIEKIKHIEKLKVCASLGALTKNELKMLKKAGLSRYHHNIETSSRFYPKIVTTHKFSSRIATIKRAKEAGLSVCSGGIIGMGENWKDRIEMALLLKKLDVDSVPLNFLIPIKGTPLENMPFLSITEAIRTIAVFRIILKDKTIRIAAGREKVLGDFMGTAFLAGANGIMVGGYLTRKSRNIKKDHKLLRQVEQLWKQ